MAMTTTTTTKPPSVNMVDLEAGTSTSPYPEMTESQKKLRWGFIRKVYCIVAALLLVTVAVSAVVITFDHPILAFIKTKGGLACIIIVLVILPIISVYPLNYYHQRRPVNYVLLGIFTVSLAFGVGLACTLTSGKVILEAAILTSLVVVSLTLFTIWAAKRGYDFYFLGPFLFGAFMVLLVFGLIQIFFPLGRISVMIYGCVAAIIFCGYIVYDTDNLLKRYTYDEYFLAAVALYIDITNLFQALLNVFRPSWLAYIYVSSWIVAISVNT